ncbi:MAG: hypothetical protein R2745_14125 [Vicinamibacterales bacterium]
MPGPGDQTGDGIPGAELVQAGGDLAGVVFRGGAVRGGLEQPVHQTVHGVRVSGRPDARWRRLDGRRARLVGFLDDLPPHELVAVPGHRPDEARIPGLVREHAAQRPHCLRQRAVGHDDIPPDVVEDLALRDRLVPTPHEQ